MVKIAQSEWFEAKKISGYNNYRVIDGIKYKFIHAPPHEPFVYCMEVGVDDGD